jgi:hypothetical protein
MKSGKRAEDGQRGLNRFTRRQRPPGDTLAERLTFEKLHGEKQATAVFIDLIELADVGMADARGGPRFTPKPLSSLSMGQIRPYSLDGDRSIEPLVMRGIDDPHSALSKLADDAISACGFQNALPDRIIPHGRVVVSPEL